MPEYIEQVDEFDPMSSIITGSNTSEDMDEVLDYSNIQDDQTQIPIPDSQRLQEKPQEASYLIPKRVIVRRYRLKK